MAKVGPQRAADLTGKSKSTIQRAMKAGKLSYEIDSAGRRVIDVSELERVFGLAPQSPAAGTSSSVEIELEKAAIALEAERMKMRIKMLEDQLDAAKEQIEDLKEQRDQWQKQAQQVLITSQYSQKQAEELKEELRERDRRIQMRRQMEQQRLAREGRRPANATVASRSESLGPRQTVFERQRQAALQAAKSLKIQSLWQRIRGSAANSTSAERSDKAASA